MKISKITAFLLTVLITIIGAAAAIGQTIQLQPVVSGLSSPLYVTNAKDGSNRLFIVEQSGAIKVLQPGATTATTFIDISDRITAGGEQGLLGMAFHPQYSVNRKFYVNYTRISDGATVIAEFTASASNPNQADAATQRILFTVPQPFTNHNGGMVEFGPDGYLYIGLGDGGSANDPGNRAQNRSLLLGKMLRIDVNPSGQNAYTIPADNPFVGANTTRCDTGSTTSGNTCQEIYALGLRNPFRWSFDRGGSRQLYAGDVGQGALEEIDIITRGGNFGWRVYEGTNCTNNDAGLCTPTNYTPPIFEYFNSGSQRCSITGGYVYRGRRGALPQGTYVFADYCTGEIMIQSATPRQPTVLLDTPRAIPSFGEDEAGELYICEIDTGAVERIVNPNAAAPSNVVADFDGDLRTDVSVFRPSSGFWYVLNSFNNTQTGTQFGQANDKIAPGDFDGDGKTDLAVFRPATGIWYILGSVNNTFRSQQFGQSEDTPVAADYDGDRKSDIAVFRPSSGIWYILSSINSNTRAQQFGLGTDRVAPADYNGDGQTDLAVFRPSNRTWYINQSLSMNVTTTQFGESSDVVVPGDYDGDGKADIAVWRPSNGVWYASQSSNSALFAKQWGVSTDTPAPGDYDADGKTDPAVTRTTGSFKNWYITQSLNTANARSLQFGSSGDINVPTNDVP